MKWLEVISLRGSGNLRELLDPEVKGFLDRIDGSKGLREVRLYFHNSIHNDLAVHLLWETDSVDPQGTPIGQRLVQILKSFGLTNHNLWKEEERK